MNFQNLCLTLQKFWVDQDCAYFVPYDMEVGAGTFHPATFLRVLGPEPWKAVYMQPSRRPADGRYGENPNRLYQHYQLQVVLKPSPDLIQQTYLQSLEAIGISIKDHDIRFDEDDWESPTLGAWGLGWQVLLDGLEITQFTYFQQMGGLELKPITVELTYGLERIATYIQDKDNVYDLAWNEHYTYGDIYLRNEWEYSRHTFEMIDPHREKELFDSYEEEALRLVSDGLIMPAYDHCLKCSHSFNLLDAAGAIGVSERARYIGRVRRLARQCAELYLSLRQELNFPWLKTKESVEL
ncbi:glycine--tRNA ligase subunit alpha [candidate division CSSED10-310 bacterium]|uniref:Glycine--tRNA ligase alpha subunit n=1 Tax=candidate division CSSED10-310 bacterium TaxID=2855610 RepID=A0ABV6YZH2_UNCC1